MTLGESRIRVNFNPTNDDLIHVIKSEAASLIDLVDGVGDALDIEDEKKGEFKRLQALAMTHIETAAMFAVKCVTI